MVMVWIKFVICASIVVFTGAKLSEYGDAIAEKTKLTGAWVGLLLLPYNVESSCDSLAKKVAAFFCGFFVFKMLACVFSIPKLKQRQGFVPLKISRNIFLK